MNATSLHYIYDPLCGWCYGASPLIDAVRAAGIDLAMHAGNLFAEPTRIGADKRAYVRAADARIGELTGQRFGDAYLDHLLGGTTAVFWSLPPIAAVIAAAQLEFRAGPDMLKAIQKAHYVDGRRVAEEETLTDIAREIGLDGLVFELAFSLDRAREHVAVTHRLMVSVGLQGYPGFAVESDGRLVSVPHERFYGHPADFADAVVVAMRQGVS